MKGFISKNGGWLLLVLFTVALISAVVSTIPDAEAANQGNVLFKQRYGATSTTPIDDIDQLNGVTSNVQTQLDATTSSSLADTKVNVGQSTGLAAPKSVTISGDGTASMTNAGAMSMTLSVNSVSAPQLGLINTVTVTMGPSTSGAEVEVESGSLLLEIQPISGFSNDVTLTKAVYPGTGNVLIINTDAHAGTAILNAIFLRP